MKPLVHAKSSVHKYGGTVDDYLQIHTLFDETKGCMADVRHRAILHNSFGPFIAEKVFGYYITNSEGKQVSVRQIAEDHIVEDMGCIPSVEDWLKTMPRLPWMDGRSKARAKRKVVNWDDWNEDEHTNID